MAKAPNPNETAEAQALVGKVLDGRYRVDSVLGAGGMGMVFRGVQTSVQRPVALKTLHTHLAMAPAFFERFKREAEIASRLHHPNIITIFDFGRTSDGLCYYVMEMLPGESLRQRVKQHGPLSLRQAAAVVEQTALGVGHAHKQQVIHRDLKPHNIMITEVDGHEYVKVLDFGLVKALEQEDEEQLTSTGQVLGTPQYMPPEQAGGEVVDQRSDLYSLTGVFYYCLTGHSPFGANTVRKALTSALAANLPAVATYRKGAPVPEAIDRFLKKGLEPEKDDRYQTADEFIQSLHAALAGTPDSVLDAVPQFSAEGAEGGGGSSSASRKGSRPASKSISSVSKPIPRASSRVEVSPSVAGGQRQPSQSASAAASKGPPLGALVAVAAVLVVIVGAAVAWKVTQKHDEPVKQPVVLVAPEQPKPKQPEVTPKDQAPEPPPSSLKVTLKTRPAGAEVLEDGVLIGKTPLTTDWSKGTTRTLTFRLAGFKDLQKPLRPEADQDLDFPLESVAPRPTPGKTKVKKDDDIGAFE